MYLRTITSIFVLSILYGISSAQFLQRTPMFKGQFQAHDVSNNFQQEFEAYASRRVVENLEWLRPELQSEEFLKLDLSPVCLTDYLKFINGLTNLTKWAIKMADATGKPIESGIMDGNVNFEGRYLQCIRANEDIHAEDKVIEPMYCNTQWYRIYIEGRGLCLPNSCSNDDVLFLLQSVYAPYVENQTSIIINCERGNDLSNDPEAIVSIVILCAFGVMVLIGTIYDAYKINHETAEFKLNGSQPSAYTNGNQTYERYNHGFENDKGGQSNFETIGGKEENRNNNNDNKHEESEIKATVIELKHVNGRNGNINGSEKPKSQDKDSSKTIGIAQKMLLCFSLYKNVPLIVSAKQPEGMYKCLNGIRAIAMTCVVLGHSYSSLTTVAENMRPYIAVIYDTAMGFVMTLETYVDTFFILSAFLVSLSFLKQLKRCNGKLKPIDIFLHYFNRYWRLTPIYMLTLMISTNLTHYWISGPFAYDRLADVDNCGETWWKNLLYINNMGDMTKSCYGISWYLAVDMQLFIMAPPFVYLLYRWETIGIVANIAGFCGGIIANIVLWEQYFTQTEDTEDPVDNFIDIYIKPWARCPVYFMGILLGYFFYKTGGKIKMPKVVVAIGWILALSMWFMTTYMPTLLGCVGFSCPDWDTFPNVLYMTFYRPMWGIWVCWLIVACVSGYAGLIDTFLSWSFFVPLSKLSYLCYLVHIIVIVVYHYSLPIQYYFTHFTLVYTFCGTMSLTYACALVMAVVAQAPLLKLMAVFIPSRRDKTVR